MAQCESKIFFPDDFGQLPQFTDCPREAETARRTLRLIRGEILASYLVKLCHVCAREWDEQAAYADRIDQKVKAASAGA